MNLVKISSKDSKFNKAMEIYKYSFPDFERRKEKDQLEALEDNRYHFEVIYDEEQLVGILLYWDMGSYKYIEHFAIDKNLRGKSYGSKILREFCRRNKNIVLEIDPPIDRVSIKRLNFYKNLGFTLEEYDYSHPSYRKDCKRHSLKLMTYGEKMISKEYENFNLFLNSAVLKYSELKNAYIN